MNLPDGATTEAWIDKASWPRGPWDDEPDRIEWHDPNTGLPCLMLRSWTLGHWCGYVGLPPGHPWHGRDPELLSVAAHGGLTSVGPCHDDDRPKREQVCHEPQPGEPDDVWWLGFDCAHGYDDVPNLWGREVLEWKTYRDVDYVIERCTRLAEATAITTIGSSADHQFRVQMKLA
jgi:hypothetical protein